MRVRKCLSLGKENIKAHQVMYHAIYLLCRLAIFLVLDIHMYYIQPELWIGDYRFGSGKGARRRSEAAKVLAPYLESGTA